MKYVGYALMVIIGSLVLLLLIAFIKTLLSKRLVSIQKPLEIDSVIKEKYAQGLLALIHHPTIAPKEGFNEQVFSELHDTMKSLFPHVFETMNVTIFKGGSLLLKWEGCQHDAPLILMAHQDVVPAPKEGWNCDPFIGAIQNNEVYGRGSFDTKSTLYAFYQACEELIIQGFQPVQDVYLASSADEEISGIGAQTTVEYLKSQGIKPKLVLDEGGAIVTHVLPSADAPMALIGVLEKGYVNFLVKAKSSGGHSSTPPKNTPIAKLSKFIVSIEKRFPLKTHMIPEVERLFNQASHSMKGIYRYLFGNLWLFKGLLTWLLPTINPYGRAMLSTTIAYTMMKGSDAENVIPNEASILLNCRIHPIQDIASTEAALKKRAEKYGCLIEKIEGREATPIVSTKSDAYQLLERTIKEQFEDVLISPYVILGGTDCRHYTEITDAALRFSPVRISNADLKKMHGINESIGIDALTEAVLFYQRLIQNFR